MAFSDPLLHPATVLVPTVIPANRGARTGTASLRWSLPSPTLIIMRLLERVTIESGKCGGRPCIRGMRIRVKDVLDMLAEGATQAEILADFPDLQAEDIQASIAYAARYLDHSVLVTA